MDVSSDRGRGLAHPPAAEHRQDGTEPLLIASGNDSEDHSPNEGAINAVGRIAPRAGVHSPIIPGRHLVRSITERIFRIFPFCLGNLAEHYGAGTRWDA